MVTRQIDVTLNMTPVEAAEEFWFNNHEWQSKFFNRLGLLSKHNLCMQLQWVTDCGLLTYEGRNAMQTIGEYAGLST